MSKTHHWCPRCHLFFLLSVWQKLITLFAKAMYGNTEIRKKGERLVSLLVSLGWNRSDRPLSSLRRSITLGDPTTCMDIITFLICNLENDFGSQLLSLYKIDVPRDEENISRTKSKDWEPDVDHTQSIGIQHSIEFILGPQHQINVRFRRISKFIRSILGIHKVYLEESQFVRQGFSNKKLDMISDMIDAMTKQGKDTENLPCTGNSLTETTCEYQSQYVHPRDTNPPCLFRDMSYMLSIDGGSTQDVVAVQDPEEIGYPASINDTLYSGTPFVIEEQEHGIPQTTTNPLFWAVSEYSPECSDSHSSEDECEIDIHDQFATEPSCLLESLELCAQQALKFIDDLPFN